MIYNFLTLFNRFNDNYIINNQLYVDYFNNYFDKIFILNLDKRPDRWAKMISALNKLNITNYERFSAYNGNEEPHYTEYKSIMNWTKINSKNIKKKNKMRYAGSYGIIKSSLEIINIAKERGYNSILILQDDCIFIKNFLEKFYNYRNIIDSYKLLYLGATQHIWENIDLNNSYYFPVSNCMGAFAVGIHADVFDDLISEIKNNLYYPIDAGALSNIQSKYINECYVLYPNLIIADIGDSDIRKSRSLKNNNFKWDIELYSI